MTVIQTNPVFIAFEGLDGSGKTTLARRTAEELGAAFMTTPSEDVRRYRDDLMTSLGGCQEAAQLFYLATVFAAAREIEAHLKGGRSVVLDRYFLSTQAYAAFRGSALDLDHLAALLVPADLTVFVDAPLAVRIERLSQRGASAADRETMVPAADARLRAEHVARFGLPVVGELAALDSSAQTIEELVARITAMAAAVPRRR